MLVTVLDIETTGYLKFEEHLVRVPGSDLPVKKSLLSDNNELLEVGFLVVDTVTKQIVNSGCLYFYKPYFNIEDPESQKVHGLTREFLKQFENKFEENLIALNALMQSTLIIGKNSNAFDIKFINAFLEKHGDGILDIEALTISNEYKTYSGSRFYYHDTKWAIDMQKVYKDTWREYYYQKNGVMPLPRRVGTLSEYIESIPNGQLIVDAVYADLPKIREGGAHTALYDAVMTYVVWLDATSKGLC